MLLSIAGPSLLRRRGILRASDLKVDSFRLAGRRVRHRGAAVWYADEPWAPPAVTLPVVAGDVVRAVVSAQIRVAPDTVTWQDNPLGLLVNGVPADFRSHTVSSGAACSVLFNVDAGTTGNMTLTAQLLGGRLALVLSVFAEVLPC